MLDLLTMSSGVRSSRLAEPAFATVEYRKGWKGSLIASENLEIKQVNLIAFQFTFEMFSVLV